VEASDGQIPTAAVRQTAEHTRIQFCKTTEQQYEGVSEELLATVDGLPIDAGTPMHDAQTIDAEDFPVLIALNHLRAGRDETRRGSLSRYHHVVVDEAQELAPIELELVGRAVAKGGTLTVSGDENQQVDDTAYFASWSTTMAELGAGANFERIVLEESHRCPPEITQFARKLRTGEEDKRGSEDWPRLGDRYARARANPLLRSLFDNECHLCSAVVEELSRLVDADSSAKVAVVCRNAAMARQTERNLSRGLHTKLGLNGDFDFEPGVVVTCVSEVKGLEFDYVVVPDASAAVYPDKPEARRALYVAATRAIRQLWLVASGEWSPLLWPSASCPEQAIQPSVLAPQA
jgi:DNA helicase IV